MNKACLIVWKFWIAAIVIIISNTAFSAEQEYSFTGVKWTVDRSNSPTLDKAGDGKAPSLVEKIRPDKELVFETLSKSDGEVLQGHGFSYESRQGYHWLIGTFSIRSEFNAFDKLAIMQTKDAKRQNFSTYYVLERGDDYLFGSNDLIAGDKISRIDLDKEYTLSVKTKSQEGESYQIARLYNDAGDRIWEQTSVSDIGSEHYYQIGAYRSSGNDKSVTVIWDKVKFYTGE